MRLIPGDPAGRQPFPCLSCIARGLPCLLGRPWSGELLPPLFTLACMKMNSTRAVCFLWHFPSGNPWEIPVSRFHGTRCLVMSGLSSTPARRPEQRPPEPDRHGLHTLSAARGKAQSRLRGQFLFSSFREFRRTTGPYHHLSFPVFLNDGNGPGGRKNAGQGKAATGSLPWPLQLTTYENQLDPLILKSSLLPFRRDAADNVAEYMPRPWKINSILGSRAVSLQSLSGKARSHRLRFSPSRNWLDSASNTG